jgi:hypothetical protein
MLIATSSVAVALLASTTLAESPLLAIPPPMIVNVSVAADISSTLVSRVLVEAGDIWSAAGFTLVWRRITDEVVPYARVLDPGAHTPPALRVTVGNQHGVTKEEYATPLGWIVFEDLNTPQPEIYLSYANARALMEVSRGVVGRIDLMPRAELETLLARAMGRALAHEIGHYLLASKVHTTTGLMQAKRTAAELFASSRRRFGLEVSQRAAIVARLVPPPVVVSLRGASQGEARQ